MEEIRLNYDVTGREVRQGLWLQFLQKRLRRQLIYSAVLLALFAVELIAVVSDPANDFDKLMMMLSGTLLILIWVLPALARRNTARVMDGIETPFSMTAYLDRIEIPQGDGTYTLRFDSSALTVTETASFFLIDPADGQFFLLPKRCFAPGEVETLSEWLKAGLGERYFVR